jgi:hypothetical protein
MKLDNIRRRARRPAPLRIFARESPPKTAEGLVAAALAHSMNAVDFERQAKLDLGRAFQWMEKAERERTRASKVLELLEQGFQRGDRLGGAA